MKDDRDNGEYVDKDGRRYRLTDTGDRIPPEQAEILGYGGPNESWPDYDTSEGHCGLCGRLTCPGTCFK